MAADREETIQAATRAELDALLARHRWLEPVGKPRRVPASREWFVRVRARRPLAVPAARRRYRPGVVAAVVGGALVVLGGVTAAVWWLLDLLAAHWTLVVGVLILVALAGAALRRR